MLTDAKIMATFGQGEAASARGEYRADCPHEYGSEAWEVWMLGFDYEEGPRYRLNAKTPPPAKPSGGAEFIECAKRG